MRFYHIANSGQHFKAEHVLLALSRCLKFISKT